MARWGPWPGAWRRARDRLYRQCWLSFQPSCIPDQPHALCPLRMSPSSSLSALPLGVTSEKLAVVHAHALRLTWRVPISVACLPSSLSRPHHARSVFTAAPLGLASSVLVFYLDSLKLLGILYLPPVTSASLHLHQPAISLVVFSTALRFNWDDASSRKPS